MKTPADFEDIALTMIQLTAADWALPGVKPHPGRNGAGGVCHSVPIEPTQPPSHYRPIKLPYQSRGQTAKNKPLIPIHLKNLSKWTVSQADSPP